MNSRYYNPEWGRFINFDNYGGQVGELLSHNGYAYCMNNPVNMVDENGNMAISGTVVGALALGVLTIFATPQERYEENLNVVGQAMSTLSILGKDKLNNTIKNGVLNLATAITIAQVNLKLKDKPQENYWKAELKNGEVSIGEPISYFQAIIRVAFRKDIMCKNEMYAYLVASQFNGVLGPEKDKN